MFERLLEHPGHEPQVVVESEPREVAPDRTDARSEEVDATEMSFERLVGVEVVRIRFREALERVGQPKAALTGAETVQRRADQDRGAAAPHACLDEIALDAVADDHFDASLDGVEPLQAD